MNSKGLLSLYYPDFIVEDTSGDIRIVETKGEEDIDVLPKWNRLKLWCDDATKTSNSGKQYKALFVKHSKFQQRQFQSFKELVEFFKNEEPLLQVQ